VRHWGTPARKRRRLGPRLALGLLLGAVLVSAGLTAAPPNVHAQTADPARIEKAAKGALSDPRIQTELPGIVKPVAPRIRLRPREPQGQPWNLGAGAKVVLWTVVAVAAAALLYLIFKEVSGMRVRWRRKPATAGAAGEMTYEEEIDEGDRLVAEADQLAAQGQFAEAIHLLLVHGLRRLEVDGMGGIRRAFTAREVLRRSSLPRRAKDLLAVVVAAVEFSHFGGRSADAKIYGDCRTAFLSFTEAAAAAPAPEGAAA
jgi:hypothetical protein